MKEKYFLYKGTLFSEKDIREKYGDKADSYISDGTFDEAYEYNGNVFGLSTLKTKYGDKYLEAIDQHGIGLYDPLKKKESTREASLVLEDTTSVSENGELGVQEILQQNKDVPFVKRMLDGLSDTDVPFRLNKKGEKETHKMASASDDKGAFAYPTLQYIDGKWVENESPEDALARGNIVRFGSDEEAQKFAEGSWKAATPASQNGELDLSKGDYQEPINDQEEQLQVTDVIGLRGARSSGEHKLSPEQVKERQEKEIGEAVGDPLDAFKRYEITQQRLKDADDAINRGKQTGTAQVNLERTIAYRDKVSREATEALQFVRPHVRDAAKRISDNIDDYTTTSVEGFTIPDVYAIDEFAKEIAREAWPSERGYLKTFLYNEVKSAVAHKIIEPKVEDRFSELFKSETGKTLEEYTQGKLEVFIEPEKIAQRATLQAASVSKEINEEAKQEFDALNEQVTKEVTQLRSVSENLARQIQTQFGGLISAGKFVGSQEQYEMYSQAMGALEEQYRSEQEQVNLLNEAFLGRQNEISTKFNARLERQVEEIDRAAQSEFKEKYEKYREEYEASPETIKLIKDTYSEAYKEVIEMDEYFKNTLDEYLPGGYNMWRSFTTSLGSSVKGISSTLGYEEGKVYGDYLENKYQLGSTEIEEAADLLNLTKLSKSVGQLGGSMLPGMALSAGVALATAGVGAPTAVTLLSSGLAGWSAETMDITGRMYEDVFAETGSVSKAEKAATQSLNGQIALMPAYAFEGLPFIGKSIGVVKSPLLKIGLGAGIEYVTEMMQEYPQNLFETAIREGKPFYTGFENASWESLKSTALNIAPVALLGAGGQISSLRNEIDREAEVSKAAEAFVAKSKFADIAPDQRDQFLFEMTQRSGVDFSLAYVSALYSSGNIDKVEMEELTNSVKSSHEILEGSKKYSLSEEKQKVLSAFMFKRDALAAQVEAEENPTLKKVAEARLKEYEAQIGKLAKGEEGDYAQVTYPDGSTFVLSTSQAKEALNDQDFVAALQDGSMNMDVIGVDEELTARIEEIFPTEETTEENLTQASQGKSEVKGGIAKGLEEALPKPIKPTDETTKGPFGKKDYGYKGRLDDYEHDLGRWTKVMEFFSEVPEAAEHYLKANEQQRDHIFNYLNWEIEGNNLNTQYQYEFVQSDGTSWINGKGFSIKINDFENVPRTEEGRIDFDKATYDVVSPKGEILDSKLSEDAAHTLLEKESAKDKLEAPTEKKPAEAKPATTEGKITTEPQTQKGEPIKEEAVEEPEEVSDPLKDVESTEKALDRIDEDLQITTWYKMNGQFGKKYKSNADVAKDYHKNKAFRDENGKRYAEVEAVEELLIKPTEAKEQEGEPVGGVPKEHRTEATPEESMTASEFEKAGYELPGGLQNRGVKELKAVGDAKWDVTLEDGKVLKDVTIHKAPETQKIDNKSILKESDKTQISYGGKAQEVDLSFREAAQKVRDNLGTAEKGYVKLSDGKVYEISTERKRAKLLKEPRAEATTAPKPEKVAEKAEPKKEVSEPLKDVEEKAAEETKEIKRDEISTVRDLSNLEAEKQQGLVSGAVFSALKKGDVITVGGKQYTVETRTKATPKTYYKKDGTRVDYKRSSIKLRGEDGKPITGELWEYKNGAGEWVGRGQTKKRDKWGQLSRDIEGDITVDLINENNQFHEVSDSFKKAQETVDILIKPKQDAKKITELHPPSKGQGVGEGKPQGKPEAGEGVETPRAKTEKELEEAVKKAPSGKDKISALKDLLKERNKGKLRSGPDLENLDIYTELAAEYIKQGVKTVAQFAKEMGDKISPVIQKAWDTATKEAPPKEPPKPKKPRKKRYEQRELQQYKSREDLTNAVKAKGLEYEPVTWKRIDPLADEMLSGALGATNPQEALDAIQQEILQTTEQDYIDNPDLSTLYSQFLHKAIAHYVATGDLKRFQQWSDMFSERGRAAGRLISAMQDMASPEAIQNRLTEMLTSDKQPALEKEQASGKTGEAEIKEIKEKLKLSDEEVERLKKKVSELIDKITVEPPKTEKKPGIKERRSAAKAKIRSALRDARAQASAMGPINVMLDQKMLTGVKELVETYIEEGVYKASQLKKKVLKELGFDKEFQTSVEENWKDIYDKDLQSKSETAKEEDFVKKLEARAKRNAKTPRRKPKDAEDVLLATLLAKVNETVAPEKGKKRKPIQELIEGIQNRDFSDGVWQEAMNNVKLWLDNQNITDTKKAEIVASLEDSITGFMETPFARAHLRKAIQEGANEMGVEIENVVKSHWTEQNTTGETLKERLISELGLSEADASYIEERVVKEVESIFEEKRVGEIRKALGLDADLNPKSKKARQATRIVDKIIEGINLGLLDDSRFQDFFAEKYGFMKLTPEAIRQIKRYNDLIHIHQGSEMSRKYMKDLMDYIQSLKKLDAEVFFNSIQSLTIRSLLTGLSTIAVNIPIGSYLSYFSNVVPKAITNPVAYLEAQKAFRKSGLKGIGLKSFLDVMKTNYNVLDEEGAKFDERQDVRGDLIDYYINNYSPKEMAKQLKEADTPAKKIAALGAFIGRSYLKAYQIANFAKAWDVIINHPGSEIAYFMDEYMEQAKLSGKSGFTSRFDFRGAKKITEAVKKKMAYDPETKEQIEAEVETEISEMRARGEKVGYGYKPRRVKEKMQERREDEKVKRALNFVKAATLMEAPNGLLGRVYEGYIKAFSLKPGKEDLASGMGKTAIRLTTGLFLRISVTSIQRVIENIPIIGLATPGIFYDYKKVPVNPGNPKGTKKWSPVQQDPKIRNERLAVHAVATGIMAAAAANMFDWDEDEKKLKLNPDRWIDITGFGWGTYHDIDQLNTLDPNKEMRERKNYMVSVKIGDEWFDILPARLIPHLLPTIAILGGMRDEAELSESKFNEKEIVTQFTDHFEDIATATTEQTFNTVPKFIKKTTFAGQKAGVAGVGNVILEQAAIPLRSAVYPNMFRDTYNDLKAIEGAEKKGGRGWINIASRDVPVLDDMMLDTQYDHFGYPIKRTSKIISSLQANPLANVIIDNLTDFKNINQERYDQEAHQLKMEYRPNVKIKGYWAKEVPYALKQLGVRVYGEKMREKWLDNEKYIKDKKLTDEMFEEKLDEWHDEVIDETKDAIKVAEGEMK